MVEKRERVPQDLRNQGPLSDLGNVVTVNSTVDNRLSPKITYAGKKIKKKG